MSDKTAKQLYADVQSLTTTLALHTITPNTANLFNANLDEALKEFPTDPILKAIGHATEDTTYHDLLTMVGQLMTAASEAANMKAAKSRAGRGLMA